MPATTIPWSFEADFLQACSCDYGCPCEFSAPPTQGFCEGIGAWHIHRGHYKNVPLDGLGLGYAAHWPKAMHEGNGTVCIFIDERGSQDQRAALLQIATGQAGGVPFEIVVTTFSTVLEPRYVPFEFHINGAKSRLKMGDQISANLDHIRNPVTGEPEHCRIEHSTGFIFKTAEALAATENCCKLDQLQSSWPNKAAFVAHVSYPI